MNKILPGRGAVYNQKEKGVFAGHRSFLKGMMAEGIRKAKPYFWVCIKYIHNCHSSGALQGLNEIMK